MCNMFFRVPDQSYCQYFVNLNLHSRLFAKKFIAQMHSLGGLLHPRGLSVAGLTESLG